MCPATPALPVLRSRQVRYACAWGVPAGSCAPSSHVDAEHGHLAKQVSAVRNNSSRSYSYLNSPIFLGALKIGQMSEAEHTGERRGITQRNEAVTRVRYLATIPRKR